MSSTRSLLASAFILASAVNLVSAHTWVEQLSVIGNNGTFIGEPGYPRGNYLRNTPGFGDPRMVYLLPPDDQANNPTLPLNSSLPMCMSTQSTQNNQTEGSPRLQAAAGASIALRYQENGHVTLPENQPGKPANRGNLYVYGTTEPHDDDLFTDIHNVWNADQTGGDRRGVLLSTQNFDDGRCYQVNDGNISVARMAEFPHVANTLMGADMWCQQDIVLPTTAPTGKPYTLYWVWDWPTAPGTEGLPDGKWEIYTTCIDVDIVSSANTSNSQASKNYLEGQSLNEAAIPDQFSAGANPTAVGPIPSPWNLLGRASASTSASATASASLGTSVAASSTLTSETASSSSSSSGVANGQVVTETMTTTVFATAMVTVTPSVQVSTVYVTESAASTLSTVDVPSSASASQTAVPSMKLSRSNNGRFRFRRDDGESIQIIPTTINSSPSEIIPLKSGPSVSFYYPLFHHTVRPASSSSSLTSSSRPAVTGTTSSTSLTPVDGFPLTIVTPSSSVSVATSTVSTGVSVTVTTTLTRTAAPVYVSIAKED